MKTTILTFALALATVPFTFAAQTPATPAPAATASKPAVTAKTKKTHVKPVKKGVTAPKPVSTTPASK